MRINQPWIRTFDDLGEIFPAEYRAVRQRGQIIQSLDKLLAEQRKTNAILTKPRKVNTHGTQKR